MRRASLLTRESRVALAGVLIGALGSPALPADYTVAVIDPPVANHMIVQDGPLPLVSKAARSITLYGCRGQYVPASFVVDASGPLEAVRVEVGRLRGSGGRWPEDAVDVRVVKDLYLEEGFLFHANSHPTPDRDRVIGGAGGWAAFPTLLVHDDRFLAIEPDPDSKDPYRPMKNVVRGTLRDAAVLQPVEIQKRKQFWITVQVPPDASPGIYRTSLRIVPRNSKPSKVALQVEVYPFDLLPPMLEYSIYYPAYLEANLPPEHPYKFGDLANAQYAAEIKNMLAHGLGNPNLYDGIGVREDGTLDFSKLGKALELREGVGMRPKRLYLLTHPIPFTRGPLKPDERERTHRYVKEINAWAAQRGYDEVYFASPDEWSGEELRSLHESMAAVREAGGRVFAACFNDFFDLVGDVLDRPVLHVGWNHAAYAKARSLALEKKYPQGDSARFIAEIEDAGSFQVVMSDPGCRRLIDGAHRLGHRIYCYTTLAGTPLPDLQRRNEGLGLWQQGFDGTMSWAYTHNAGGIDQIMRYQKVYRTENGVLDTLNWEGFREGVNDVRYLTTLMDTLKSMRERFPDAPMIRETDEWLKQVDVARGDLDAIRREMARRIVALSNLGRRAGGDQRGEQ